ncbi:MAG TPA: integrase core domain-containing protein, partial [Polyangia bacterium]|nr:integrase core domain-containing protein [Polyangia bacterium]HZS39577.1 integrase core domain-containing protein [Polyangia bacterium]
SRQRHRALSRWLVHYNRERPHGSLGGRPPISRLNRKSEQRA